MMLHSRNPAAPTGRATSIARRARAATIIAIVAPQAAVGQLATDQDARTAIRHSPSASSTAAPSLPSAVAHRTVAVDGLTIFYREAGPRDAPTVLLLHGFPASSHMYRTLIPALADRYHVVAPDFPGFGQSSMPGRESFAYKFANLADVTRRFTEALGLDR